MKQNHTRRRVLEEGLVHVAHEIVYHRLKKQALALITLLLDKLVEDWLVSLEPLVDVVAGRKDGTKSYVV